MLAIVGAILILIAIFMLLRLFRNSRRPKLEVTVHEIKMRHVKQDKKKQGPQHKHGRVSFTLGDREYDEFVLLKNKKLKEGDVITISYKDGAPDSAEQYRPKGELIASAIMFVLGVALLGGSLWVMDAMDWW